jgi:hypothetical protein
MAEIKIEKKPMWPWVVVALLVLGVVAWLLMRNNDTSDDRMSQPPREERRNDAATGAATGAATEHAGRNNAVQDYVTFVDDGRNMDLDHTYTSGALERLKKAVKAKADQLDHDIKADLERIDEHVDRVTDDPQATNHANHIRDAAETLSTAMRNMQRAHYPNLDGQAQQVEQAARNIDPKTLTLDQRDAVKGFFDRSAELLRNMN